MQDIINQIQAVKTIPQAVKVSDIKDLTALRKGIKDGVFKYYEGINGYWVMMNETN